ncbi:hypothetical protein IQ254_07300 [Nodosilinea sp. LEGE 07088]|uniref:hypothetical protein n=1 Tax=Nodosilinea sp. LEGE 07088 TaxID=2777968 RepID=UPI00187E33F1|nr:hypothetical protein [Nodosilinea sp. LEGE 07088]MBE9137008.1 hypothetical protein [Nodosilinea sp. LEGE 07088]
MTSLDDLTLLQWFVSGDATLEANQSLRVQPTNRVRQLLGRRGKLLATAYDEAFPPRIEVRRGAEYSDILHQVLVDHQFVPVGQGIDSQVLCYAYYPIPEGYHLVYDQARQLWKQWWTHPSHLRDRHLQLDLFVLAEHQWYSIRSITLNRSTLYVETMRGETVHHGDDMMVWLEKDPVETEEATQFWTPPPKAAPQPVAPQPVAPQPVAPQPVASPPAAPPKPVERRVPPTATATVVDPSLAPLVYALDDKIYVQTTAGLVIIEGQNLRAHSATSQPVTVGVRGAFR